MPGGCQPDSQLIVVKQRNDVTRECVGVSGRRQECIDAINRKLSDTAAVGRRNSAAASHCFCRRERKSFRKAATYINSRLVVECPESLVSDISAVPGLVRESCRSSSHRRPKQ